MLRCFLTVIVFLFIQPVFSDDLLNILNSKVSLSNLGIGKKTLKEEALSLKQLLKKSTKEQDVFFKFFWKK